MSDPETLRVYARRAGEYADFADSYDDPLLAAFIAALPPGARVLDLGCGPGRDAAAMARAGLVVEAMDAVPEMVAMAARHPGVTAKLGRFDDLSAHARFDGIWANFSLLHAPRADLPRHLRAIKTALKPGGVFHIALKTGKGSARDTIGRLYSYYSQPELERLLTEAGFAVTNHASGSGLGLDGTRSDWIALRANG
jgi:SAM-dependent methyltransferase